MSYSPTDPVETVIARCLGPSKPRDGDRSDRLWWVCPFHNDNNPSLTAIAGEPRYHCFGCDADGDAIDFVRRLNPSMSFREALDAAGGVPAQRGADGYKRRPVVQTCRPTIITKSALPRQQPRPDNWPQFALGVVRQAEDALWSDRGPTARAYLHDRGLADPTIRAARLGFQEREAYIGGVYSDANLLVPAGVVIPWFEGEAVTLVNVRRQSGDPRYLAMKGSRRGGLYPSPTAVATGRPLVLAEGELDALLLGQELAGLASVVTLGTAGDRPGPATLGAMLGAVPWLVAYDADGAGEASATRWLARSDRCRRVRPPAGKDWTEARQAGVDLRAWWADYFRGEGIGPKTSPINAPAVINGDGISESAFQPFRWWWLMAVIQALESGAEDFEERAAIMEYDGGLPRAEAERLAMESALGRYCLNIHACV